MSDITMCSNEECPVKKNCYRHEATPSKYWQSYASFTHQDDGGCEYFMIVDDNEEDHHQSNEP